MRNHAPPPTARPSTAPLSTARLSIVRPSTPRSSTAPLSTARPSTARPSTARPCTAARVPLLAAVLLAVALLTAACGAETTETSAGETTGTGAGQATGAGADAPTDPPESSDPAETDGTRVGCANGPFFPIGALDATPPLVEDSPAPELADAIAPFLTGAEGMHWPQDGWRVLDLVEDERALLVHPGTADLPAIAFMDAEHDGDGWRWSGASSSEACTLVLEPDVERSQVDWVLDPSAPVPGPEATSLQLLATERGCASGEAMGDRFRDPTVTITADAVLIELTADHPDGDQTCQGNPERAVTIELEEPLGQREVRDARSTGLGDLGTVLAELLDGGAGATTDPDVESDGSDESRSGTDRDGDTEQDGDG